MITQRPVPLECKDLIKEYEPLSLTPFLGMSKIWTIGWAHTRTVRSGLKITEDQADQLLHDDLVLVARLVQRLVAVPINDLQFGALVSFVFEVGTHNFEVSTLLRLLNRGWYDQVPAQLMRYNKISGVASNTMTSRRAAEGRLWNTQQKEAQAA